LTVTLDVEVLRRKLDAIALDMARVIERTAFTTFVKETADFTCGIVSTSGEFVAYPWSIGATSLLGLNLSPTLERLPDPAAGDVFISNDPFLGGPICTHLPDLNLLRPVFADGKILCWLYAMVHATDVGGSVPGSVWVGATEVYQEGLRIRPVRLWSDDKLDESILNFVLDNTRIPELNWGDLKAVYSALLVGEREIDILVGQRGSEGVRTGIEAVLEYAETEARSVFAEIPRGRYEFVDYMEDDRVSEVPVRIKVCLESTDSGICLDFSGSDSQVRSSINIVTGDVTHPFLCQALIAYLVTKNPEVPKCSSILRPVTILAPPGMVVNAVFPAATGARYATSLRVSDAVLGALALACPGEIPAAGSGMLAPIAASVVDPLSGRRTVQVVEPLIGGGGGRPASDGLDGVESVFAGYLRNTPVEVIEQELGLRVLRYCLVKDTGGAGQFRGGMAVCLTIEALRPDTVVVARGLERFRLEPWGLAGGRSGTPGRCWVTRSDNSEEEVGTAGQAVLQPGDRIDFRSPAGGGYGRPEDRATEAVVWDLENEVVSLARAQSEYSLAGDSGEARVTELPRNSHPSGSASGADTQTYFDYGDGRERLEADWPPELQDMCTAWSERLPVSARDWYKHAVHDEWVRSSREEPSGAPGIWLAILEQTLDKAGM
jgi:N-methylhydantoinase B